MGRRPGRHPRALGPKSTLNPHSEQSVTRLPAPPHASVTLSQLTACDFPHRKARERALLSCTQTTRSNGHDFFPAEPESARNNICGRRACRGCGRPDTPEADRQCCAGLRMAVPQDRFRDHDLRVAGPAAGSACVETARADRCLCPGSIAGKHSRTRHQTLALSLPTNRRLGDFAGPVDNPTLATMNKSLARSNKTASGRSRICHRTFTSHQPLVVLMPCRVSLDVP